MREEISASPLIRNPMIQGLATIWAACGAVLLQGVDFTTPDPCDAPPGTFDVPGRQQVGGAPRDLELVDVDADGLDDLIYTQAQLHAVVVRLATSATEFGVAQTHDLGGEDVVVGDWNGDGFPDLAAVGRDGSTEDVGVALNDGLGGFGPAVRYATGFGARSITADDVDGDGDQDLAVACAYANEVWLLCGAGDGTFAATDVVPVVVGSPADAQPHAIAAADLDGDALPELFVADVHTDELLVLSSSGGAGYAIAARHATGPGPAAVLVHDFDDDGRQDVLVSTQVALELFLAATDGTLQAPVAFPLPDGVGSTAMRLADVTLDGALDVLVCSGAQDRVTIFERVGGALAAGDPLRAGDGPAAVVARDVGGDGALDLLVTNSGSGDLLALHGDGSGAFGPRAPYASGPRGVSVVVADWNADGVPDLAAAYEGEDDVPGGLSIHLGLGDGTFVTQASIELDGTVQDLAAGDLDLDGAVDLVVVRESPRELLVVLSNADGTFAHPTVHEVQWGPESVAVADLDGDGAPDVVVTSDGGNGFAGELAVFFGGGDGTLGPRTVLDHVDGRRFLEVVDLDQDGARDLVVSREDPWVYEWLAGDGAGSFAPARPLLGLDFADELSIGIEDLDGDGVRDLAVPRAATNVVAVYRGLGGSSFAHVADLPVSEVPRNVITRDLDLDGAPDLVASGTDSRAVTLFLGRGDATFEPGVALPVERSPFEMQAADLDADGLPELVVLGRYSQTVSVLRAAPSYPADDFEPNETCAQAVELAAGTYARLSLEAGGGADDYYSIQVPPASLLSVEVAGGASAPDLACFLHGDHATDPGCGSVPAALTEGVLAGDTLALGWSNTSAVTRSYTLRVTRTSGDCALYDLAITVAPAAFGAPMCPGDGSLVPCPCGNEAGEPYSGCRNASGAGAKIAVTGTSVFANADAVFHLTQAMPHKTALLLQGETAIAVPFKNGVLCMGPETRRLQVSLTSSAGSASTSGPLTGAGFAPGTTRYYQWWYRAGLLSTCGTGSNFSSGLRVDWQ